MGEKREKRFNINACLFELLRASDPLSHSANLGIVAVRLVQDLDNDVYLVNLPVVSRLLPHTTENLGESSLAQTLILKHRDVSFYFGDGMHFHHVSFPRCYIYNLMTK